jgi:hypothetical protein
MRLATWLSENRAIGVAVAIVLAGCSSSSGFGSPAGGPNPVQPYGQPVGASPTPMVSGSGEPFIPGQEPPFPQAGDAATPTPTPAPNSITIVGPALRLAYDGSAKDPAKAQRMLELSFALENTTQNAAKVSTVVAHAGSTALGTSPIKVSAAPGQTSEVVALALKTSDDPAKYKDVDLSFMDDAKKMVGSAKLDVPPMETQFTPLDEKHPKGPFSVDSLEISSINVGKSPHFECTFALTNATGSPVSVTEFDIKPPKGDTIKVYLLLPVPARSVSGFLSIVLPYNGDAVPSGTYTIIAMQTVNVAGRASAVLL